jgi:hypothetical protein
MTYKVWLNSDRTVLLTIWDNGEVEIAVRDRPGETWGPPIRMEEQTVMTTEKELNVCVCGHRAEDHAGLCLTLCCEDGCSCPEYVRDFRIREWPPSPQGEQLAIGERP